MLEQNAINRSVSLFKEGSLTLVSRFDSETIQALQNMLDSLFLMDHKHRIIAGRDGYVISANERVDELLAEAGSLGIRGGQLCANQAKDRTMLEQALAVGDCDVFTVLVANSRGDGHLILRATQFDSNTVSLCFCRSSFDCQWELPNIESAFGLTPSEAAIVTEIFNGNTAQVTAEKYGISIHTVRAHLRHCYGKLEVNSREELWRKLQGYCAY